MHRYLSCALVALVAVADAQALAPDQSAENVERVRTIYQDAVSDPGNDIKFEAYLATLPESPKGSGVYVVEGDIGMSRDAVRAYLAFKRDGDVYRLRSKELIVNLAANGRFDYWVSSASRRLTYVFDSQGFTPVNLAFTRTHLAAAASDWQKACPKCEVQIRELTESEIAANVKPTFVVTYLDERALVAKSFFPSDPVERRVLYVYPQFFEDTGFDPTGVMRHELGHVLGYRHEHIGNIPGCATESGQWRAITPYTPNSVMHYFCGNRGSLDLSLRKTDIEGHTCLYVEGRPCGATK